MTEISATESAEEERATASEQCPGCAMREYHTECPRVGMQELAAPEESSSPDDIFSSDDVFSSDDAFLLDERSFSGKSPPVVVEEAALVLSPVDRSKWVRLLLGVRLAKSCMTYRLVTQVPPDLQIGDSLLVETRSGEMLGQVAYCSTETHPREAPLFPGKIVRILRRLTGPELQMIQQNGIRERQAKKICQEIVQELGLEMEIGSVVYSFDQSKATFFFTAESRIDFRELVRLLARRVKVRVEMRQIGVRDETRLLGGLGPCGKIYCCSQFLKEFHPVSVRMAKNQELSLNPESISGVCGRLLCCLEFENEVYLELRRNMPKPNAILWTKEREEVVVRAVHPMPQTVDVVMADGERRKYRLDELFSERPEAEIVTPVGAAGAQDEFSLKAQTRESREPNKSHSANSSGENRRRSAPPPARTGGGGVAVAAPTVPAGSAVPAVPAKGESGAVPAGANREKGTQTAPPAREGRRSQPARGGRDGRPAAGGGRGGARPSAPVKEEGGRRPPVAAEGGQSPVVQPVKVASKESVRENSETAPDRQATEGTAATPGRRRRFRGRRPKPAAGSGEGA